jgi:hypothetical protein
VRRLLLLLIVGTALWGAPGAFAAGWCGGSSEPTADLPDATTGRQIHAIWAVPSDGPDTFATGAPKLADDLTSISNWWVGPDPTRIPRLDTAFFPAPSSPAQGCGAPEGSAPNACSNSCAPIESVGTVGQPASHTIAYAGPELKSPPPVPQTLVSTAGPS